MPEELLISLKVVSTGVSNVEIALLFSLQYECFYAV